jgi:hypothetical protein
MTDLSLIKDLLDTKLHFDEKEGEFVAIPLKEELQFNIKCAFF